MTPLDMLVFWSAVLLVPAYVCRLNLVRFGKHSSLVVLFHWALFAGCLSSVYAGWVGVVGLSDVTSLVSAAAWLAVSWYTWGDGAPEHTLRAQAEPLAWPALSRGEDREGQR